MLYSWLSCAALDFQFCADMWLMFDNAWAYNKKTSRVYKYCSRLAEVFEQYINGAMVKLGYCCGMRVGVCVCVGICMCVGVVWVWCTNNSSHVFITQCPHMSSTPTTLKCSIAMENRSVPSLEILPSMAAKTGKYLTCNPKPIKTGFFPLNSRGFPSSYCNRINFGH